MKSKFTIGLIILTLLNGCDLFNDFGEGNTEIRQFDIITNIDLIKVNNTFDITLVQDNKSYISITCGANIQPKVEICIKEKILILNHSVNNRWLNGYKKIKLEIHIPSIPTISVHKPTRIQTLGTFSSGQFYLIDWGNFIDCNVDVNVNFLRVDSSGDSFGSFLIKGSAQKSILYCRGSANFDYSELLTDTCQLSQESILDMSINVNKYLDVSIKSSGNVYYTGDPTIKLIRKGDGKLIKQ